MRIFLLNIFMFLLITTGSAQWRSYKIYRGDTINRIDLQGRKQGLWLYFNDTYKNGIIQQGFYKDGKKQGEWIVYYKNGNIKSKSFYKDNHIFGPVTTYYKDGTIREQGRWERNKWVGDYRYYYPNGKLKFMWHYDKSGKRTGKQVYYYDSGKKYVEGTWSGGKENGWIKEYYPSGQLHVVSLWKNGLQDGQYLEYYNTGALKLKKYYKQGKEDSSRTEHYTYIAGTNPTNAQRDTIHAYKQFSGSGFFRFYNADGKLTSEGEFRQGVLYQGKRYFYDKDGNLFKTVYIEEGRVKKVELAQRDTSNTQNN